MKILARLHDIERQQCKEMGTNSKGGPTRRDRSNIAVARFLDMPRRIAQERVPTASNVGSRDVTWPPSPHLSSPFAFFRVFRGPHSLGKAGHLQDRNPIPDRSSCPLRPSVHLLFLAHTPTRRHADIAGPACRRE